MQDAQDLRHEDALVLALLPDPEGALAFLRVLEKGRRLALATRMAGLSHREVAVWRKDSQEFDDLIREAEMTGTASIDDTVLCHIEAGFPGWTAASKTLLQRRDDGYADRQKVERDDTVKIVEVHKEQSATEWESGT